MRSAGPERISDEDWSRHERIIADFEAAWQRGERPKIGHYLPVDEPRQDELLVELVHADLEFRIKEGESVRVEDYLRKYPALARRKETILELIRAERSIRRRKEPGLRFDRYRSRFPEFQAELQTPLGELSTGNTPSPASRSALGNEAAAEPPLPRRFGKFELRQKLGAGSFGVVYRAWDTVLKREVAIKLPRNEAATVGPELAVFLRDARTSIDLHHPNIVEILDAGPIDGVDCMVRAYIEGMTLADRLREGHFTPEEAAALLVIVADAIAYAHERKIIHRDLKPSNILLDLDGQPHVMDFGLAKREAGESTLSPAGSPGLAIGTPAYMSPEQARGETLQVDARSDVYSLGVIFYELLTGSMPFRGRGRMLQIQIQEGDPIPPRSLNDEVSADLDAICLKTLAKDPGARYQTAKALADDLRNFLEGQPVEVDVDGVDRTTSRSWWKSPRMLARVTATAVLFIALASTTVLWRRTDVRRARNAEGLERIYRSLLDLAGLGDPRSIESGGEASGRARKWAEELLPILEGDPALIEVDTDARCRLAERASAEGSDRVAGLAWERAVLACEASLHVQPGRPSRIENLARALARLAEIRQRAGQSALSRKLFARSLRLLEETDEILQRRAKDRPEDDEAQFQVAECQILLARARKAVGEPTEIHRLDSIARELVGRSWMGTHELKRAVARWLVELSEIQIIEGQPRLAEEFARKGHQLMLDASPDHDGSRSLARTSLALARANRELRQFTDAIESASEAVRQFEAVLGSGPGRPEDRRALGEALLESGQLLNRPPRRGRAIEKFRRSLQVWLALNRDYPGSHDTLTHLGEVRACLARTLESEGRTIPSIANRLLATIDQARAVALAQGEASYRSRLQELTRELIRALRNERERRSEVRPLGMNDGR